jgi:hypothetical protein
MFLYLARWNRRLRDWVGGMKLYEKTSVLTNWMNGDRIVDKRQ